MLPGPARISFRFSMTHVHRYVHRQRHVREHSTVLPLVTVSFPKNWLRNVLIASPVPVVLAPQGWRLVTPGQNKVQVLAVRYLVLVNSKCWNIHSDGFKFIVPTEFFITPPLTQRGRPGGNINHPWLNRRRRQVLSRPEYFLLERQLMKHVRQCFRMHQAMLDGHVQKRGKRKFRQTRIGYSPPQALIENLPQLRSIF